MKTLALTALTAILLSGAAIAAPKPQKEDYYNRLWCNHMGGKTDVRTRMGTIADCVIEGYAVETDFDTKWAEAIGQSLHYGLMLDRKPAILLIMKNQTGGNRQRYLDRLRVTIEGSGLDIRVFIIEAKDYPTR